MPRQGRLLTRRRGGPAVVMCDDVARGPEGLPTRPSTGAGKAGLLTTGARRRDRGRPLAPRRGVAGHSAARSGPAVGTAGVGAQGLATRRDMDIFLPLAGQNSLYAAGR